ncbi:MAG: CoA-transferase [Deltaproteobacteria bacterium]|nr:CoA-transferase [Deltaproteobacteria bacterium]
MASNPTPDPRPPSSPYTPAELMVSVAAREISDGDVVFVGMRLPLLAFILAKKTHAPGAIGLFENGVLREAPASSAIVTMGDPPNIHLATMCCDMLTVMGFLQKGKVDVGFIGGAEVDRFGNLNTTRISLPRGFVRLPGSGGGGDIASLSKKLLIIMPHEKRRFVGKVGYITSSGYGLGGDWRKDQGLVRGGPVAIITTLGVLRFHPETKEAFLAQTHPGISSDQVKDETGWDLKISPDLTQTPLPTAQDLSIIRQYDPRGFWTGQKKDI